MKGLQSADVGLHFPRRIPGHAVCLNATRFQEQGCFILDREEMDEKRALCNGATATAKNAQHLLFTELCKIKACKVTHVSIQSRKDSLNQRIKEPN